MATTQAYIAVYDKPYGLVMDPPYSVQCPVTLLLYKGTFTTEEFAQKMVPLSMGEAVAFTEGSLTEPAAASRGLAT